MPLDPVGTAYTGEDHFTDEVAASARGMVSNYGSMALERALCEIQRMKGTASEEGIRRWEAIAAAIGEITKPPR